jgi:hypothetical protein
VAGARLVATKAASPNHASKSGFSSPSLNAFLRLTDVTISGRSVADGAMLVYDRHNLIYAYGHLEEWKLLLRQIGMKEVAGAAIKVPVPHSHHYHEFFDEEEHRLLNFMPWHQNPLREQDQR